MYHVYIHVSLLHTLQYTAQFASVLLQLKKVHVYIYIPTANVYTCIMIYAYIYVDKYDFHKYWYINM